MNAWLDPTDLAQHLEVRRKVAEVAHDAVCVANTHDPAGATWKGGMSATFATHVGSLPRTQKVADLILAREQGKDYDSAAFDAYLEMA